MHSVGELLHTP